MYNKIYEQRLAAPSRDFKLPETKVQEDRVLADIVTYDGDKRDKREFIQHLNRECFSTENTRKAWDVIEDMVSKGTTVDPTTVMGKIPQAVLAAITAAPIASSYIEAMDHCIALSNRARDRQAAELLYKGASACSTGKMSPDDYSILGDKMKDLAASGSGRDYSQTILDAYNQFMCEFEAEVAARADGKQILVPTSIPTLDRVLLGGFRKKALVTLAARPGCGKSALVLQMALTAARAGFNVMFYSVEMSTSEVIRRALLSTGCVKDYQLSPGDRYDIQAAEDAFQKLGDTSRLRITDRLDTLEGIGQDIRSRCKRKECDIAIVDHLHHLQTDPRLDGFGDLSQKVLEFKRIAKECDIPVLLVSQLNRDSEAADRPPILSDLRGCGKIEEVSDVVLMLGTVKEKDDVRMLIRKNRSGKGGDYCIVLATSNHHMTFEEVANNQQVDNE